MIRDRQLGLLGQWRGRSGGLKPISRRKKVHARRLKTASFRVDKPGDVAGRVRALLVLVLFAAALISSGCSSQTCGGKPRQHMRGNAKPCTGTTK